MLLWLWCRLADTAPIQPLAWEPPYVEREALKKKKKRPETEKQFSEEGAGIFLMSVAR